jgi:hypothetical protein
MSKVTYSGVGITESAGKLKDVVYSRNRGGHFKRAYVIPTDPQTQDQLDWRASFSNIASMWQVITQNARDQWNQAAYLLIRQNTLGNNYRFSGYNYFVHQTINIILGDGVPTFLPVLPGVTDQIIRARVTTLDATQMIIKLNFTNGSTVVSPNNKIILFGTDCVSPGINYKRTGFAGFYSWNPGESTNNIDTIVQYELRYPTPIPGKKIFFRAAAYQAITGQRSEWFYFSGIVS